MSLAVIKYYKKLVKIVDKYSNFPHNNSSSGIDTENPLFILIFDDHCCYIFF